MGFSIAEYFYAQRGAYDHQIIGHRGTEKKRT